MIPKPLGGFGTSPKTLLLSAYPAHIAWYPPGAGAGERSRYEDGGGTRMEELIPLRCNNQLPVPRNKMCTGVCH